MDNMRLLKLEKFNLVFGWHAYMLYEKHLADKMFFHHFIRNPIFKVWQKYKQYLPEERPPWINPMEVIQQQSGYKIKERSMYKDLIYWQHNEVNEMKPEYEVPDKLGWWRYNQLKDLFNTDKTKYGFRKNNTELEEILLGEKKKIISKLYKCLLRWYTEDETIKTQMVQWAQNFNNHILLVVWEYLWKRTLKITTCIRLK